MDYNRERLTLKVSKLGNASSNSTRLTTTKRSEAHNFCDRRNSSNLKNTRSVFGTLVILIVIRHEGHIWGCVIVFVKTEAIVNVFG